MTALVGFIIVCAGMIVGKGEFPAIHIPVVAVGLAVCVAAPLLGGILNRLGMGQD